MPLTSRGKKGAKAGDWEDDIEYESPQPEELETAPAGEEAEEEANDGDFLAALRKSKNKKKDATPEESSGAPVLKSKKEKEKEKKEREKLRKKQAAEKKKQAKPAASSPSPSAEKEEKPEPVKEPVAEKKGKKVPAGLAALRKQLEAKKAAEEEERRMAEEEEQLRLAEEAESEKAAKEKEEARAAKKEREKLKREQLKAEGKLLSKKQKEEKRLQERRREQFLQAGGIRIEGLENQAEAKPKKVVYGKKKSKQPKAEVVQPKVEEVAEEEEVEDWEKMADDEVVEDWEAVLEIDEAKQKAEAERAAAAEQAAREEEVRKKAEAEEAARLAAEKAVKEEEERLKREEALRTKQVSKKKQQETSTDLRSPICCILGHVDTGKTKLLDKIRQTNVQGGEAGGITQQIGATYFPMAAIKKKTESMAAYEKQTFDVPGLLIIDTPGHESFSNLRSRGSSLCNIAILVIDIMHGLEPQTIESIRLLRERKAPFVVALNKIDRLYDWQSVPNNSFRDSFNNQTDSVKSEFDDRLTRIKVALAEQGLNSELYFQNKNMSKYVSIVPTSAVTGEGVPDILWLLLELTQKRMSKQLMYLSHKLEATVLEVKVVEGFGTTIDVVLSNGVLKEGDRIILCGLNGPIATNVRALLTPQPMRELRLKSEYVHHKEVKAALGVKIAAHDLEKAVAGSRLLVAHNDEEEEDMMDEVMDDLTGLLDLVDSSGRGVTVQASTLGSLEALLDFLKAMKIPVMSIGLGPVYKRDVMKASTMLDKAKEFAVMLCFDVKVDKEADQYAEENNIRIFKADIIYHLFDEFTAYQKKLLEERRENFLDDAIFPCVLKTIQIINKRNPMIIGVDVQEGTLRVGTPIAAVRVDPTTKERQIMQLGRVASLEVNHKSEPIVKKNQTSAGVAMRLENPSGQQPVWGRHVDDSDLLYSLISRRSIDTLKDPAFRDSVPREDWMLIKNLKPVFDIN